MNLLDGDLYRRTYMSYASSQPYPKGQTAQLGPHPSAAVCVGNRSIRNRFIDRWILEETLPILPRAEAIIEKLRLSERQVAIHWLANAHKRMLAATDFSGAMVLRH
jgi:hypothetical protein